MKNVMDIYAKRQEQPVMISFAKSLSPTHDIPFPAVTICSESKAAKHEIDVAEILQHPNLTNDEIVKLRALYQVCDFQDYDNVSQLIEQVDTNDDDIISTLDEIANPMDDLFYKCRFGARQFSDCENYFAKVVTDEGVCWVFNMLDQSDLFKNGSMDPSISLPYHGNASEWFLDKDYVSRQLNAYPRRIIGSGLQSGLSVELRIKTSDINHGCKRGIKGFRLSLHTPIEIPEMSKHFYRIPFKKLTTIMVTPDNIYASKVIKNYDPISRQCYFDYERELKFFKTYAKSSCELECLADQTLTLCGCVKFSMPRDSKTPVCNLSKLDCAYDAERSYMTRELQRQLLNKQLKFELKHGIISKKDKRFKKLKQMESCNCLPSCTSLDYHAEISQTDFSADESQE